MPCSEGLELGPSKDKAFQEIHMQPYVADFPNFVTGILYRGVGPRSEPGSDPAAIIFSTAALMGLELSLSFLIYKGNDGPSLSLF